MTVIRKVGIAILLFLTALLQYNVFQIFEVASIKPNLLLMVTVSFGLMRGKHAGMLTGFFSGLLLDCLFPGTVGMEALIYMWIGYLSGFSYRIFYDDDVKTPVLLVFGGELIYGLYHYILGFLLRGRIHFLFYLQRIIIPEMLYTIIITILTFRLLYRFNQFLLKLDKRRIDRFG